MAGKKKKNQGPPVIENRRARFEFHILDTVEVGIILMGSEVKAARMGHVSLAEGYVRASSTPPTLELIGVSIGEYPPAGAMQHKLNRIRRLLAHRKEILRLAERVEARGMTIVPLKLFFGDRGFAKLQIGLAQGKTRVDKRHAIAKRDVQRDIARAMSKRL